MCFSTAASFAGGIIISGIGIATIKKVQKRSFYLFASIPLFFGLQQISEGFVWMTLPNPAAIVSQKAAIYFFLIMAKVFWPVITPLAVLLMEENPKRIKWLKVLLTAGALLSLYYGICLILFNSTPTIKGHHIQYSDDFPLALDKVAFSLYAISSMVPFFISSVKRTQLLGLLMFLSCLLTAFFYTYYITSVWCFFAAIMSVLIYFIIDKKELSV